MKLAAAVLLCAVAGHAVLAAGICTFKPSPAGPLYRRPGTLYSKEPYPAEETGVIILKRGESVRIACPGSTVRISVSEQVTVICAANDTVIYNGVPYSVDELGCNHRSDKEVLDKGRKQTKSGNVIAGGGYSSDSQQVVSQLCYNAAVSPPSEPTAYMKLDSSVSYSELESTLGTSISVKGEYEQVSLEAKASYLRSMKTKDYSMSFNYYYYVTNNIAVQILGKGQEALTDIGKQYYDDGDNEYFGLLCGDNYISSYKQGALLLMGINVLFDSFEMKNEFSVSLGAGIYNLALEIERKIGQNSNQFSGSVSMQALQIGGDPSKLANILSKDSSGEYYIQNCGISIMQSCVNAANGMLNYAQTDFASQLQRNISFTPIFSDHTPIAHIDLNLKYPSFVDADVIKYREQISSKIAENEHYMEKLYSILHGYPVTLESGYRGAIEALFSKAASNLAVVMAASYGAAVCYNEPYKCEEIRDAIFDQIRDVSDDLDILDDIKYTLTMNGQTLYSTGGTLETSWALHGQYLKCLSVSSSEYTYRMADGMHFDGYAGWFSSMKYEGDLCNDVPMWWDSCSAHTEVKITSPFYFEEYNSGVIIAANGFTVGLTIFACAMAQFLL